MNADQIFKDVISNGHYRPGYYMCNALTQNGYSSDVSAIGLQEIIVYMTDLANQVVGVMEGNTKNNPHIGVRYIHTLAAGLQDDHTMRSLIGTIVTLDENDNEKYYSLLSGTKLSFFTFEKIYMNWDNRPKTLVEMLIAFDEFVHNV